VLVAVVSDTHGDSYNIRKILPKIEEAEVLIHLGDYIRDLSEIEKSFKGKILGVKGNCDFGVAAESELLETIGGMKVFITHGHRYDVKHGIHKLQYKGEELGADIVLYGHTHASSVEYEGGIWIINPGSVGDARDNYESFAMLEIDESGVHTTIVEV
jgi:uncharacterized protein